MRADALSDVVQAGFGLPTHTYKDSSMKTVRNTALALAAAGALALGQLALAQENKQPDAAPKPEAAHQHRGQHGQGGEHAQGSKHGRQGMSGMREMRGNCHGDSGGQSRSEHNHS